MFSIEKPIHMLLQQEPFYAHFLLNSRIVFDPPNVPTAGAAIINGSLTFAINTDFFFKLKIAEQAAVLKHEIMHMLLDHCGSRGVERSNHDIANVAMDCAINQYIKNLPGECITLKKVEEFVGKSLQPFQAYEYYYDALLQANAEKQAKGQVNNHEFMEGEGDGEGTPGDKAGKMKISAEQARAIVNDAAKRAVSAAAGNVPDYLIGQLAALDTQAKVSWKQQLRNIVSSIKIADQRNTRKKIHRRFGLDQPGKKKQRRPIVGVCCDSSGSVSDEAYASFMTEVYNISKHCAVTYLVQADCEVQKVDVIKGKAKKEKLAKRHGHGGTAYSPAIEACVKKKCDIIIYFGDMDSADKPVDPRIPFIWVVVGNQPPPGDFGKVIRLDSK